jgi:hypothetical protein
MGCSGRAMATEQAKCTSCAQDAPQVRRRIASPSSTRTGNQARLRRLAGGGQPLQAKLTIGAVNDPLEQEADAAADRVMRMADPNVLLSPAVPTLSRKCSDCAKKEEEHSLQRETAGGKMDGAAAPPIVDAVLNSPGHALDPATHDFMASRFGVDFSDVRIHADAQAAQSAAVVDARAYTVGRNVVFGAGQYDPGDDTGRRLLAHELAHVRQQRGTIGPVQRTPARQVSCANALPLRVPGQPDVADPVGIITAAETRANQMMDDVINSLDFTRQQIIGGAPASWPTISDALATGLRLMGLDPDDAAIWTAPAGTGTRSVPLVLRRLRLIRGTIGAGSFFFFCLGTGMTNLGTCGPPTGSAHQCDNAVATTCAGQFLTVFCPDFWSDNAEDQAARIIHESAHNFATFIGDTGRFDNAECFARLVQVFAGVPDAIQRVDLCPDP